MDNRSLSLDSNNTTTQNTATSNAVSIPTEIPQINQSTDLNSVLDQLLARQSQNQVENNQPTQQIEPLPPILPATQTQLNIPKADTAPVNITQTLPTQVATPTPPPTPTPTPQSQATTKSYITVTTKNQNPTYDKNGKLILNKDYLAATKSINYNFTSSEKQSFNANQKGGVLDKIYGNTRVHKGSAVDVGTPIGTPIKAIKSGGIIVRTNTWNGESTILYPDGTKQVQVHQSRLLPVGTRVNVGDIVGYTGNSGWSTGPHLHIDITGPKGENLTKQYLSMVKGIGASPIDQLASFASNLWNSFTSKPATTTQTYGPPAPIQSTPATVYGPSMPIQSKPTSPITNTSKITSTPKQTVSQPIMSVPNPVNVGPIMSIPKQTVSQPIMSIPSHDIYSNNTQTSSTWPNNPTSNVNIPVVTAPIATPKQVVQDVQTSYQKALQDLQNQYPTYNTKSFADELNQILQKSNPEQYTQTDYGKNPEYSYEDKYILANYGKPIVDQLSAADLAQARTIARRKKEQQDLLNKSKLDTIASQRALANYYRQANPLRSNPYLRDSQQAQAIDNQIIQNQQNQIEDLLQNYVGKEQNLTNEAAQANLVIQGNPEKRRQEFNNLVTQTQLQRANNDANFERQIQSLGVQGAYQLALEKAKAELTNQLQNNSLQGNLNTLLGLVNTTTSLKNRLAPTSAESLIMQRQQAGGTLLPNEKAVIDAYYARLPEEQQSYNDWVNAINPIQNELRQKLTILAQNGNQ